MTQDLINRGLILNTAVRRIGQYLDPATTVRADFNVFAQITRNLDLEIVDLPIAEIQEVVEYLHSRHIPETSGIVSTLKAIDNAVGVEIAFQIEMIQLLVADSTEN